MDGRPSLRAWREGEAFRGRFAGWRSGGDGGLRDAFAAVEAGAVTVEGGAAEIPLGAGQRHRRRRTVHAGAE